MQGEEELGLNMQVGKNSIIPKLYKALLRVLSPLFLFFSRTTTSVSQVVQFLTPISNTFTLYITVKLTGEN